MRSCRSGSPGRLSRSTLGVRETRQRRRSPGRRRRAGLTAARPAELAARRRSAKADDLQRAVTVFDQAHEAAGHTGRGGEFGLGQLSQQTESADPAAEHREEGIIGFHVGLVYSADVHRSRPNHGLGTRRFVTGLWTILSWRRVRSGRCLPAGSTSVVNTRKSVSPGVRRSSRPCVGTGKFGMNGLRGVRPPAAERPLNPYRPRAAVRIRGTGFGPRHRCTAADPGAQEPPSAAQPSRVPATATPRGNSSPWREIASQYVLARSRRQLETLGLGAGWSGLT